MNPRILFFLFLLLLPALSRADSLRPQPKLYVTNSEGDDVTVVDPTTAKVLGHIVVGLHPHGIAAPADGRFILVSIEGTKPGQLVWIDPATDTVTGRMDVGPAPNQLAVTPDGRIAYVPCSDGYWDVIDLDKRMVLSRLFTGGRPHNTLCSADGKRMFLAPMGAPKRVTVVDTTTHKKLNEVPFGGVVRPIALSPNEKRLYANVDGLVGIEAADLAEGKVVERVPAELTPEQRKVASRSHGLAVRPDGKEAWECDVEHHEVHVYDLSADRPKQIATIPVGERCYWVIFSADGKTAYVSVRGNDEVAFIDTTTKKVTARVTAGKQPKRLLLVAPPQKDR